LRRTGAKSGSKPPGSKAPVLSVDLPRDADTLEAALGPRVVRLTNLRKLFWPELGVTKGDLLRYYAAVAPALLPHLHGRAMVMKRYPNGAGGEFFFMKRAPSPRPDWIQICSIAHGDDKVVDFPMIQDLAALLWVVNLGCIDLNPWYSRCDDTDRPDFLHFDLDPVPGAGFDRVCETALLVRQALDVLKMPSYAKTTGSKGIHVYVPIERGPTQKDVWTFAKHFARALESHNPRLVTAVYERARRPEGRVLVDYNQNAWGQTLASVYSVRPHPKACVSTPVTWEEVERGITLEEFRIDTVPDRVGRLGDLWAPVASARGRFRLQDLL
jgi:bifunctional non-homologous end joining protein LigD